MQKKANTTADKTVSYKISGRVDGKIQRDRKKNPDLVYAYRDGKYLGYAFWATVGGCVSGVLVGEKILPYIIVTAYGIMYPHMNTAVIPYNLIMEFQRH